MRARIAVIVLVLAAVLGSLLFRSRDGGTRGADAASAVASGPGTSGSTAAFPRAIHDPAKREEIRARLLAASAAAKAEARADQAAAESAASAGRAAPVRGERETNDLEEFGRFLGQAIREDFLPMARACAKDLASRKPDAGGTATIAFELLGDKKIGGVVNEAEIVDAGAAVGDEAFETCIRESLYGVYFDPPPAGGRATLNFPVTLDGTGGVDENVDDFHLKDRRNEKR